MAASSQFGDTEIGLDLSTNRITGVLSIEYSVATKVDAGTIESAVGIEKGRSKDDPKPQTDGERIPIIVPAGEPERSKNTAIEWSPDWEVIGLHVVGIGMVAVGVYALVMTGDPSMLQQGLQNFAY